MAENITYPTYEQIAVLLSRIANNYSVMAENFVTVFYDTNPQEVTFSMYDAGGTLKTYTIPNRAKDFNYIKNGEGNPEGRIAAPKGTLYQDTLNGNLYVKKILMGDETAGWFLLDSSVETFKMGPETPEGNCDASLGTLYVDTENFTLYVKTVDGGKEGWIPIVPSYDTIPTEGSVNGITSGAVYTAINNLQALINTANINIAGNTSDIANINSNLNTLNSDITTVKGDITTINSNLNTLNSDITTVKGDIISINSDISSINSDISSIQALIGNISTALQEINGEGN